MLWGDVDEAIKAERLLRVQRIERLSTVCALFCLSGAIWLAWPVLKDAFVGDASLLTGLGMPVLVLLWGIVIQDLILDDPRARTRIGAASSIIWPLFLMFSLRSFSSNTADIVASLLFAGLGFSMYQTSANTLRGGIDVMRFRAMMTGIGALTILGILVGDRAGETWIVDPIDWGLPILSAVILTHVAYLWIAGDDMREERKAFRKELDIIENRLLVLRSEGAAVDQASSLVMKDGTLRGAMETMTEFYEYVLHDHARLEQLISDPSVFARALGRDVAMMQSMRSEKEDEEKDGGKMKNCLH